MSESSDYLFLAELDQVLDMTAEFIDKARHADTPVTIGAYLKMASRAMRCALEIYGERLGQNPTVLKMEQGEQSDSKVQDNVDADGGRLHGADPSSWVS